MSRYSDYDGYDDDYWALNQGRWEHNMRVALKGKRGRKALAELREALMALPEHRLIEGAVCTVGGLDKRLPPVTDEEVAKAAAETATRVAESGVDLGPDYPARTAEYARRAREEEREALGTVIDRNGGVGVCAVGALLWHRKVKAGVDPAEAFDSVPLIFDGDLDGGDALDETANGGKDAGLTYTLGWMLAYRNDEQFRAMTPEERHAAFIAWIDEQLAEEASAA
jgi:hypothetical protein